MVSKEEILNNLEALKLRIENDYFGGINAFCVHLACDKGDKVEILIGSEDRIYRLCGLTQSRIDNNTIKNSMSYIQKKGDKDFGMH